ncbi:FecR family protein [Sphingobacterium suaedae]|uniref:FecR family protein n=1 Tax=Sphingobacterium suaedae TaxID=1686402 RepID=A0ABW5KLG5_9SPHI
MEANRLKELIFRYQKGKCTAEEYAELQQFLADPAQSGLLEEYYDSLPQEVQSMGSTVNADQVLARIRNDVRVRGRKQALSRRKRLSGLYYATAAAVVLLLGFGGLYSLHTAKYSPSAATTVAIVPGQDKAQLRLDDGRVFDLDSLSDASGLANKGFYLSRGKDRQIVFKYDPTDRELAGSGYHTLSTPKGGQFQLELPDGTNIWLNAESTVKFPARFLDQERRIECAGEVYFEVAKRTVAGRRVPFKVFTRGQELEVLGTTFNVNSYSTAVVTTLVEGQVRLKDSKQQVLLSPNQQAIWGDEFVVQPIDPVYAIAWKEGDFAFQRARIQEVMESIARWYDVQVEFQGDFKEDVFTGTLSRYENIDKLLQTIEFTGSVHFSREGRKITVKK